MASKERSAGDSGHHDAYLSASDSYELRSVSRHFLISTGPELFPNRDCFMRPDRHLAFTPPAPVRLTQRRGPSRFGILPGHETERQPKARCCRGSLKNILRAVSCSDPT